MEIVSGSYLCRGLGFGFRVLGVLDWVSAQVVWLKASWLKSLGLGYTALGVGDSELKVP